MLTFTIRSAASPPRNPHASSARCSACNAVFHAGLGPKWILQALDLGALSSPAFRSASSTVPRWVHARATYPDPRGSAPASGGRIPQHALVRAKSSSKHTNRSGVLRAGASTRPEGSTIPVAIMFRRYRQAPSSSDYAKNHPNRPAANPLFGTHQSSGISWPCGRRRPVPRREWGSCSITLTFTRNNGRTAN